MQTQDSFSSTSAPLAGLRVVEFGQFIAAPAAAQTLADLGADVIKVEPAAGDAARAVGWTRDAFGPMFTAYNRSKRSVVLDLRSEAGRAQARKLAGSADVLLQNMRPGSMEKLGLGAAQLVDAFPRLVYGQVSGFGQAGPASVRPGFDIAAQAESGMMSLNGPRDGDPTRVGFTAVDSMAAHALATGVLAALVRRGTTGRGGLVDVSLVDVAIEALGNAWAEYGLTGELPMRCGNGQPHTAPAADVIATADGMVVVSAYTQEHFPRLCAAIGREDMAIDPRFRENAGRVQNRAALRAELSAALRHLSSDAVSELLTRAGVVVGAIRTMAEVKPGRAGVSADLFVDIAAPGRDAVRIPGLPLTIDGGLRHGARLPAVGEHTREVLAELEALGAGG
ncbi:CaiB/BaiF CoA-transferase family protein [Variovorax sp. Sphag1AA]|uniref:CaiB/BaiF CoA transferase family protein n=1 Tax=Variovorax sp. Sphag1AA TaxID=2587027 RepID=UPI00160F682C|nr:CoA transferase [Variovorax sp. Sphag1AA]MBB3181421.1 crotonobetainyl-CoA:carnitine CoA-transferase CaiB-like acyl-CoA transferase [Variovorax sp. Sphag1AA]